jgi:4-azaleucine resistance transporter AzlC
MNQPSPLDEKSTGGLLVRSRRVEFIAGVKAELPILLGVSPFGMIYGVLALSAGLPAALAFAMSSVVFAGSAQFVAAQLVGAGAPGIVIVFTALIVNLRHILYGASVAPYLKHLGPRWKCLLAYLLTDEVYAVAITRFIHETASSFRSPFTHWYFLGAGLAQWGVWQASTVVGIALGTQIPPGWALDFTVALTFIALVVPALTDRPSVAAALSSGTVAMLATGLPYRLGLIVAAVSGIVMGLLVEGRQASTRSQS